MSAKLITATRIVILLLNIYVFASMGYVVTQTSSDRLWIDTGYISPMTALITHAIAGFYNLVILFLAVFSVRVPPLANIIIQAVVAVPAYLLTIILLAIRPYYPRDWFEVDAGNCYLDDQSDCPGAWRTVDILLLLTMVCSGITLILSLLDLGSSVKDRKQQSAKGTVTA